jgi:DNA-directed RNA polymerase specialized sigma24 family protein
MSESDDLDVLLYAWLSEEDERRAELRFNDYFRAAFPELCRYVRSLGSDAASSEDIAQQALIKLFRHLGTDRKAADEEIRIALAELHPLDLGRLHLRLVDVWRRQVCALRDAAVRFGVVREPRETNSTRSELRAEINGRIDPLVRQGMQLGEEARERAQDPESGIGQFLNCTLQVCTHLPALAIPSNGLLYTIAKRQFIDAVRSNRLKSHGRVDSLTDYDAAGILDNLDLATSDAAPFEPATSALEHTELIALESRDIELERSYTAFVEYLRVPLTRAEAALAEAASRGKATGERARAESLRGKYDRLMAVLIALRESPQPTEDEIARRLGLTRNQVKYAIERIRSEFSHFFPDLAVYARGRRKSRGAE